MQTGALILEFMRSNPVFTLFTVLGCGYLVGRIRIGPISLGPVAGALIVSLVLGQYGFKINEGAQSVGFALFIFAVGYQAGPRFFEVLRTQGLQYLLLALFVAAVGGGIAIACGKLMEPSLRRHGGTARRCNDHHARRWRRHRRRSAPASSRCRSGVSGDTVLATIASSYAITYVVGLLGIIAAVRLLPLLLGSQPGGGSGKNGERGEGTTGRPVAGPRLSRDAPGRLRTHHRTNSHAILGFARGSAAAAQRRMDYGPATTTTCSSGTRSMPTATPTFSAAASRSLARRSPFRRRSIYPPPIPHVVIARRDAVGKRLGDLRLARDHGLYVSEVRRDGVLLPVSGFLKLQRSDVLSVVGPKSGLSGLEEILGPVESGVAETDMATFAFGIAFGALVGVLAINVKGVPVGLGMAGGLLASGILVGWLNATRPTFGRFPEAARWIFMEFGLMIVYRRRRLAGGRSGGGNISQGGSRPDRGQRAGRRRAAAAGLCCSGARCWACPRYCSWGR